MPDSAGGVVAMRPLIIHASRKPGMPSCAESSTSSMARISFGPDIELAIV